MPTEQLKFLKSICRSFYFCFSEIFFYLFTPHYTNSIHISGKHECRIGTDNSLPILVFASSKIYLINKIKISSTRFHHEPRRSAFYLSLKKKEFLRCLHFIVFYPSFSDYIIYTPHTHTYI